MTECEVFISLEWMRDCVAVLEQSFDLLSDSWKFHVRASAPSPPAPGVRHRDVYPLPLLQRDSPWFEGRDLDVGTQLICLRFADLKIHGLNLLYGCRSPGPGHHTAMQHEVQVRVVAKTLRTMKRLNSVKDVPSSRDALDLLVGDTPAGVEPPSNRLSASRCDLLEKSACVDPLPDLTQSAREIVTSERLLFPDPPDGIDSYGSVNREDIPQYAKLLGRQLRSTKVVLSDYAAAGGKVFAVGKPSGAQREVWHGTRVSEAAVRPPKPPQLVSPTALLALEA